LKENISNNICEEYLNKMIESGLHKNKSNLREMLKSTFEEISFQGKNVLDIGGGEGLLSFYAASSGASKVICLEPEQDGSTKGMIEKFNKTKSSLNLENIDIQVKTFQEYEPGDEMFDIIISHNSINHLNENACINLLSDRNSLTVYEDLSKKVSRISRPNAILVICDCSRYNFFSLLNVRNPFVPTIEWHKHQSPETWARIFNKVGFKTRKIRWSSFNSLGSVGRFLLANKISSFFIMSHFKLIMIKS
jgi:cyclopropane fatty-acyl-phospholipid synthase-like methyltransferase